MLWKSLLWEGTDTAPGDPRQDWRSMQAVNQQSRARPQPPGRGQEPGLAPGRGAVKVLGELSARGTTRTDRKRNKAGEDQKHEGRARESKPRNLRQRLDGGLLPSQVRDGKDWSSSRGWGQACV